MEKLSYLQCRAQNCSMTIKITAIRAITPPNLERKEFLNSGTWSQSENSVESSVGSGPGAGGAFLAIRPCEYN